MLAMWLQATGVSDRNTTLLMIFVGLVAFAMVVAVIVMIVVAISAAATVKKLLVTAEDFKTRLFPLLELSRDLAESTQTLVRESAPKVKAIADNLVDATTVIRSSAQEFDRTVADASRRTQLQVAKVDGMVTSALATTAEIAESIGNGIKAPLQKVSVMATQVRFMAEGALAKLKEMAAGTPFGKKVPREPNRYN